MGKRKHKDKKSHSRRREKRPRYSDSSSSSSEDALGRYYYEDPRYYHERDPSASPVIDYEVLDDSEASADNAAGAAVETDVVPTCFLNEGLDQGGKLNPVGEPQQGRSVSNLGEPTPTTSEGASSLPQDILDALGDSKGKEEIFGPKIPQDIATRWGRILVEGLTKEQKQNIIQKSLVPDNFRLAKAPLINPELIPVLNEQVRYRDKALEKSQKQLGLGISRLTNIASGIIEGNIDKIDLLRQISEASQIFLDLHYEDTKRRRKLVASSLDKKFLHMISDVNRDTYLFGTNLGEKIRASKTAERSGLQIKRRDTTAAVPFRKYNQGNPRGPPRSSAHRVRQGGQKSRFQTQVNRSAPPPTRDRPPRASAKASDKSTKAP